MSVDDALPGIIMHARRTHVMAACRNLRWFVSFEVHEHAAKPGGSDAARQFHSRLIEVSTIERVDVPVEHCASDAERIDVIAEGHSACWIGRLLAFQAN